jgi:uncharacterized RDD family membrane protein YckC
MKCESCGKELTVGAVICRFCNHNNALRGDWRSPRYGQRTAPQRPGSTQSNQSRVSAPLSELPKIVPRKDADDNLLRFPPASNKQVEVARTAPARQTGAGIDAATAAHPPWRAELKERVRQIKEKRATGELASPPATVIPVGTVGTVGTVRTVKTAGIVGTVGIKGTATEKNPIIESALNRIRWSSHTPAITSTVGAASQGARSAAAARLTRHFTEAERRSDGETEVRGDGATEGQRGQEIFSPSLRPSVAPSPHTSVPTAPITRQDARQVETKPLTPKTHRDAGARLESKPAPPSKILTPRAPRQPVAEMKSEPRSERRAPELFPQPVARAKPDAEEPLTNEFFAGATDKHVETLVIEIAQALEPPPEAEPAPLWLRAMAGACDFEIIMAAYLPIFGSYSVLNESSRAGSSLFNESALIMLLLLSAIAFIYQMVMLGFAGRTFGMAMLNLTLLNTADESLPVTRWQRILRALASTLVFICVPLHVFARLIPSRRSLSDLISGTTVARQ